MDIFFVGNGFDLHHKFPTSYINFLNIVQFLVEKYDESYNTVGKVLNNKSLQERNPYIQECYEKHTYIYNSTVLPSDKINSIVENAKQNIWFNYLCDCVSKDIKWIDFEKEILRVIEAFDAFFSPEGKLFLVDNKILFDFSCFPESKEDKHILTQFDFFFQPLKEDWTGHSMMMYVNEEYVEEKVIGSNSYHLSTKKIVSKLYEELRKLADVLRDYLRYFVDEPAKVYSKFGIKPVFEGMPFPNRVFSFNYTNTFEILYEHTLVDHIHGNTNSNIVLGINPDERDEMYSIDTTFLQFKKYFQRVFFKTDATFLKYMSFQKRRPANSDNQLWVIGHSLDSTDEDIIKQIFTVANKITVLYHHENVVKDYIKHLVEIYGKNEFDRLREKKNLIFMPQGEINWEIPV